MLKNILGTAALGIIILIASIFALFINEHNYVNAIKIVNFAEKNTIIADANNFNPQNENKLVHITGNAYSNQVLTDSILNIPNAIALFRDTEIYQWEEVRKHHDNNKISYTYRKTWSKNLINSDNFESSAYKNPKQIKYVKKNLYAKNIGLGKFYLSEDIIKNISSITKMTQLPYNNDFKIYNGFYFTGNDYDNPKIGDQKLSYSYIPSGLTLSIIAKQSGNHLETMNSKYGNFVIVMNGEKSLKTMINDYKKNLSNNTWLIRGIGLLCMFIGLNLLIQPLVNLGKPLPIFGEIAQMAALIYTIIITVCFGIITISLAWIFYIPEIAIPLIIISIITIISLKKKKKVIIA